MQGVMKKLDNPDKRKNNKATINMEKQNKNIES